MGLSLASKSENEFLSVVSYLVGEVIKGTLVVAIGPVYWALADFDDPAKLHLNKQYSEKSVLLLVTFEVNLAWGGNMRFANLFMLL